MRPNAVTPIRGFALQPGAALHDATVGKDGRRRDITRSVPVSVV